MSLDKNRLLESEPPSPASDAPRQSPTHDSLGSTDSINEPQNRPVVPLITTASSVDKETRGPCQVPVLGRAHQGIHICVLTALWQFLTGIERSLVAPTLMLYLKHYWGDTSAQRFYGIILAAFGMSILISNPFFGYAASRGVRVKVLLVLSNGLEIVGNLIYSLAPNPGICFLGRFIAGLGGGCESPLYADIARSTEEKKRTPYIIAIAIGKELGLFVGPVLTLIFASYKIETGNWMFNVYTAPGYIMAVLWLLHTFALIWYPIINREGKLVDMNAYKVLNRGIMRQILLEETIESQETARGLTNVIKRFFEGLSIYLSYPILAIIFTIFAGSFNSMCLEAFLPYVSIQHYNWTEVEVSYTYMGVFIVLLPATGCFYLMSRRLQDRVTLLISYLIMTIAYVVLLVSMGLLQSSDVQKVAIISLSLISTGIHAWSMPGVITLPDAIFSKLIPLQEIDRGQTIARMVSNGGFMVGMYVGGALGFSPVAVSVIMLLLGIFPCLLLVARFSVFNVTSFTSQHLRESTILDTAELPVPEVPSEDVKDK